MAAKRLKTTATIVTIVGGLTGIYKAVQLERVRNTAEAAHVQAVEALMTPEPWRTRATSYYRLTLDLTVRNLGKHDATDVKVNLPKLVAEKDRAIVLPPGESATFRWRVPRRHEQPPTDGTLRQGLIRQEGEITWTDRITKQTGRTPWCFWLFSNEVLLDAHVMHSCEEPIPPEPTLERLAPPPDLSTGPGQ